jgi:hypothetical protein
MDIALESNHIVLIFSLGMLVAAIVARRSRAAAAAGGAWDGDAPTPPTEPGAEQPTEPIFEHFRRRTPPRARDARICLLFEEKRGDGNRIPNRLRVWLADAGTGEPVRRAYLGSIAPTEPDAWTETDRVSRQLIGSPLIDKSAANALQHVLVERLRLIRTS